MVLMDSKMLLVGMYTGKIESVRLVALDCYTSMKMMEMFVMHGSELAAHLLRIDSFAVFDHLVVTNWWHCSFCLRTLFTGSFKFPLCLRYYI